MKKKNVEVETVKNSSGKINKDGACRIIQFTPDPVDETSAMSREVVRDASWHILYSGVFLLSQLLVRAPLTEEDRAFADRACGAMTKAIKRLRT